MKRCWFFALLTVIASTPAMNAADVVLNEWNAVSGTRLIGDGDPVLGSISGNGGNWFELLVIGDHVDMRGWELVWEEDEQVSPPDPATAAGTITLSTVDLWSDLRSGSLITIVETTDAGGAGVATGTDAGYDPSSGDWDIRVATREEQGKGGAGLVSTTTNDGNAGDFSIGNNDWQLTIVDPDGDGGNPLNIFGPIGEGLSAWNGGGIGSSEAGSLEGFGVGSTLADWQGLAIDTDCAPLTPCYDDTSSSSFGALNVDFDEPSGQFVTVQDVSALRAVISGLAGDFDTSGVLDAADIDALSVQANSAEPDLAFDLNSDGAVNEDDRVQWVEELRETFFGDADLNNKVEFNDFVIVSNNFNQDSGWSTGDFDGNGKTEFGDFVLLSNNFNRNAVSSVPEPGSLALMLLGIVAALTCQRR